MLGTLGGGSMRSFGRGTGGGGLYDFSEGLHLVPYESQVVAGQDHRFGMYNFDEYRPDLILGASYTAPYLTPGATTLRDDGVYYYIQWTSNPKMIWWTVPYTGSYNFICRGAQGGRPYNYTAGRLGGAGANLQGTFDATEGDIYYICVGLNLGNPSSANGDHGHGGGGASFIAKGTAMLSANAANASGTDRAPVVVAGGGGGTAGYNWVGNDTQASGLNASIEVSNNSDNGYWSNEATRNDSHAHVPYNQHSMIVNTRAGYGGLGGQQNHQNSLLNNPLPKRFYQANPSQSGPSMLNASDYNGAAGGAGWLETGASGSNSTVGGTRLYDQASGGNAGYTRGEGGFGGGGGARNTSGGGGGGYIGGSGGLWGNIGWTNGGGGGLDAYGGFGGTSYCNYNFVTSVTATQGPRSHLAENFGRVQIWPN
jgi:hypothetical protein